MFRVGTEAVALSRAQQLSALYRIIPRKQVNRILKKTNGHCRVCQRLPNVFLIYFMLAMGLFCTDCYRQVFRRLVSWRKGRVPGRSTLCEARCRLSPRPLVKLAQEVVKLLATSSTAGAFYRGMRLMGLDGFVMDIADSPANDKVFGRPHGSRGDGAFPQVRIVALCEAGTHVIWRWFIKPIRVGEQTMADYLLRFLQPDMLLMWDRNFFSYAHVAAVIGKKAQLLVRVKKGLIFQPIRILCDGSYLAKIYADKNDRKHDRYGIVVRVLEYTLNDKTRAGHKEKHRLITTLLDAQRDPALTLIPLYHVRWEEELTIDELKTHQIERPVLRSQTPAGVVQEIYALLLAHYVVRTLMFEAALEAKTEPLSISFVGTLKILRCRIEDCPRGKAQQRRWWRKLVQEVAEEVLPPRRNRINPRVIKRKMSKWKKKRSHHRDYPQPTRQFADTIVVVR
jgi:Insertion element 4 transposase N-terminal/Transposase DDE domain